MKESAQKDAKGGKEGGGGGGGGGEGGRGRGGGKRQERGLSVHNMLLALRMMAKIEVLPSSNNNNFHRDPRLQALLQVLKSRLSSLSPEQLSTLVNALSKLCPSRPPSLPLSLPPSLPPA
ncbi:hypothetical protein VYU27_010609, partial [Nannochloropsis oceanica]